MHYRNKFSDYVMGYFTNICDKKNLPVFGTHRLLKDIKGLSEADIISRLEPYFVIKKRHMRPRSEKTWSFDYHFSRIEASK